MNSCICWVNDIIESMRIIVVVDEQHHSIKANVCSCWMNTIAESMRTVVDVGWIHSWNQCEHV